MLLTRREDSTWRISVRSPPSAVQAKQHPNKKRPVLRLKFFGKLFSLFTIFSLKELSGSNYWWSTVEILNSRGNQSCFFYVNQFVHNSCDVIIFQNKKNINLCEVLALSDVRPSRNLTFCNV